MHPEPADRPADLGVIVQDDAKVALKMMTAGSVGMVLTSPPYFNARPEVREWVDYEDYLNDVAGVLAECRRVLAEGRFLVLNSSPVLVPRSSRADSSKRYPIPFDLHARLVASGGWEFVDDIVWAKPEGAGWATRRGSRFAADRQPLQYKAAPVTEYLLVYRSATDKNLDWSLSQCDPQALERSLIADGYPATNLWHIQPVSDPEHPSVFPEELARQAIALYSVEGDIVLDPYAGTGTTGLAAAALSRRFALCEVEPSYVEVIKHRSVARFGRAAERIDCQGTDGIAADTLF